MLWHSMQLAAMIALTRRSSLVLSGSTFVVALAIVGLSVSPSRLLTVPTQAQAVAPKGSSGLTGTARTAEGKPLEGVVVSAKAKDSTITTSVFTDEKGEYVFPPLPAAPYRVWAQAVG